jgi:thiamine biosynthesis lipoprotein
MKVRSVFFPGRGVSLFSPLVVVLAVVLSGTLTLVSWCDALTEYSGQQFMMDTVVEITVFADDRETGRDAVLEAFDAFKEVADLTDRFPEPGTAAFERSDVCRINSMAGIAPVRVSQEVMEMLKLSKEYSELSGGAFDVTVGPLMGLWGFGTAPAVPSKEEIWDAVSLVDTGRLVLNEQDRTAFLSQKGMSLDLGGIAKGYAAGKAAQALRDKGITGAIINAGGNVVTLGGKGHGDPWKVGIQDPRDGGSLIGVLALKDQAAVTSGDYQRYFDSGGKRYHHLLDPATGMPADALISVTVVCDDAAKADLLSTALFILGPEKGRELVQRLEGVEAVFVSRDKTISITPGLKEVVEVQAGEDYSYDSD